jgi:hypothetical protein
MECWSGGVVEWWSGGRMSTASYQISSMNDFIRSVFMMPAEQRDPPQKGPLLKGRSSNTPTLQHSNTPILQYSNTPILHLSVSPPLHLF